MDKVSLTSCDTIIVVKPNASRSVRIKRTNTPFTIGSCPAKGSSYMINSGSKAIARAKATRRFIPPDSSDGINCSVPRRPTASNFKPTNSAIKCSGKRVCARSGKATFSYTVISVNKAPLWNNTPMRARNLNKS